MSLFSRNKQPEEASAEAELDDTDDDVLIPPQPEPTPPEAEKNDETEQMVRELYDRLGQLSANVEERLGSADDTSHKLAALEEQMRKLSSLTEAISSRYNPFLGEAEEEREPIEAVTPVSGAAAVAEAVAHEVHEEPELDHEDEEPAAAPELHDDELSVAAAPAMEWARPVEEKPLTVEVDEGSLDAHDEEDLPAWGHEDGEAEDGAGAVGPGARVRHVGSCFTSSQLMMRWANLLLTTAGNREHAAEFVDHYRRIGWLSDDAGDRLLEHVDGLTLLSDGPDNDGNHGTAQVHEMSLLYVERLADHARGCACIPR